MADSDQGPNTDFVEPICLFVCVRGGGGMCTWVCGCVGAWAYVCVCGCGCGCLSVSAGGAVACACASVYVCVCVYVLVLFWVRVHKYV